MILDNSDKEKLENELNELQEKQEKMDKSTVPTGKEETTKFEYNSNLNKTKIQEIENILNNTFSNKENLVKYYDNCIKALDAKYQNLRFEEYSEIPFEENFIKNYKKAYLKNIWGKILNEKEKIADNNTEKKEIEKNISNLNNKDRELSNINIIKDFNKNFSEIMEKEDFKNANLEDLKKNNPKIYSELFSVTTKENFGNTFEISKNKTNKTLPLVLGLIIAGVFSFLLLKLFNKNKEKKNSRIEVGKKDNVNLKVKQDLKTTSLKLRNQVNNQKNNFFKKNINVQSSLPIKNKNRI